MSTAKERRSAFLHNDQEPNVVEFDGDIPDALVLDPSIKDAKKALAICGGGGNASEFHVARAIVCTLDAETREPYFEKEDYDALCEARGDAKRRLEKIVEAMQAHELGN